MSSMITLQVSQPAENPVEDSILKTFQDLINGAMNAAIATKRMDALIYEEHDSLQSTSDHTGENVDDVLSERQYFILDLLSKIAVQVPAAHPGQDRLVDVLENIPRLSYRQVTNHRGEKVNLWSESIIKEFEEHNLAFWEPRIFGYIPKWKCLGGHYHQHKSNEPEPSLENFSAFCARLFVAGMNGKTGRVLDRAPFVKLDHSEPFPDGYDPHACAAAQWLIYAGAELFEMCEVSAGYRKSSWGVWRVKFTAIQAAPNLSEHRRQLAGKALQRMQEVEEMGITTNVVYEYGMGYMDGDTIVSARPESRSYVGKRSQWNEYAEDGDP